MARIKRMVYIIGAGPGDPELISVKGDRILQEADVILYDALVAKALLARAKPGCKLIYVGKRKGKKEFAQDEINQLLVFYARRFASVVRLKGGDPFVFGRGHEELAYVSKHGLKAEVISGISSAVAAPAAFGIPLTKRGINESFWVITGTLSSGKMSHEIHLAATSSATVVVLMGIGHLREIMEIFKTVRSPNEPVAIIEHATLPGQRMIAGTASNILQKAAKHCVHTPAVIVVGSVVELREITSHAVIEAVTISNVFHN